MNNNLSVYSASAGSGKTYSITQEYIALLLKEERNEKAYKNILAITFTNKATNEMKSEILEKFKKILFDNDNKEILEICERANLITENDPTEKQTEIIKQAKDKLAKIFKCILHDYSFFSISTIDSFFQKILRGFAREIGINYNYSIELDTDKVISDAVDILLEKAEKDIKLRKKIIQIVDKFAEEGQSWNFKKSLADFVKFILISNFNREQEKKYEDFFNDIKKEKQFLSKINAIEENFRIEMDTQRKNLDIILNNNNIDSSFFKYSDTRNFILLLNKILSKYIEDDIKKFSFNECFKYIGNTEEAIKFKTDTKKTVSQKTLTELSNFYDSLYNFFQKNYINYKTAKIIKQNYFYAGLLFNIIEIINQYLNENGLFLISNVPLFLSEIAKENNSSFIYEKMGSFYENYLIDEFQDTSQTQWNSLKPLMEESLSNANKNIVVGDLKQSIYAWRGGDWELLAKKLKEDFPSEYNLINLKDNWRSGKDIVKFNNDFFQKSAEILCENIYFPTAIQKNTKDLIKKEIYSNILQNYKNTKIKESFVTVNIVEKTKDGNQKNKEKLIQLLIKEIEKIQKLGVEPKDILILVRKNEEGSKIARQILLHSQSELAQKDVKYDLISQESLFIAQNEAIKLIINCLKYFNDKNDSLSKYLIKKYIISQNLISLKNNLDEELESIFTNSQTKLLHENIEDIIEKFSLNENETNIPFLISFRDLLLDFEQKKPSDIATFINYWEEIGKTKNLRLSEEQNAIKILTIHKAKGLAADYVFIPFANWKLADTKKEEKCLVELNIAPFNCLPVWIINYSQKLIESHFSNEYYYNKFKKIIEAFNVFYVALTRAKKGLYIYSDWENIKDKTEKYEDKLKTINQLIQLVLSQNPFEEKDENDITYRKYLFGKELSENINAKTIQNDEYIKTYDIFKPQNKDPKEKIIVKSLFDREKLDVDKNNDIRQGIVFHKIFENINTNKKEDIEKSINKLYQNSIIKYEEIEYYKQIVLEKLTNKQVEKWFNGDYNVISETEIISKNKELYRPDRIMYNDDKTETIIIDYKFGKIEKKSYITKIQDYGKLLSEMKYQNISLYLWFVLEDYLLQIKDNTIEKINLK